METNKRTMTAVRSSVSPDFVRHASSSKAFNKDGNTSFTPWLLRFFITAFAVSSAACYTKQKQSQLFLLKSVNQKTGQRFRWVYEVTQNVIVNFDFMDDSEQDPIKTNQSFNQHCDIFNAPIYTGIHVQGKQTHKTMKYWILNLNILWASNNFYNSRQLTISPLSVLHDKFGLNQNATQRFHH